MSPDERRAVLAQFDAEMRVDPPDEPGTTYEFVDAALRSRGAYNWIVSWAFAAADADRIVETHARYFRARELELEWKLYAHDSPANLADVLAARGFTPDEPETLMVLDVRRQSDRARSSLPAGFAIAQVSDARGLADLAAVSNAAFGTDESWMLDVLPARLFSHDPTAAAYVAYAGDTPVAGGRIEFARGRRFAGLYGGATIAAYRKRGLFRALVARRIEDARQRAYAFITVDARETSRPILERLGFVALTTIVGWKLQR